MINIRVPETDSPLHPRITVIGVGGAGGNAVNNMIRSNLEGVEFLVCNTDAQALNHSAADRRIQLGLNITRGLGAGSRPDVGRASAEEALEELFGYLEGSNMVFITAGMGGGTGTGAAPVIARAAREHNILTVGVVTKPFQFEGAHRMKTAEAGIQELQQYVDTLIVIPNQNLFRIATDKTTFADAFKMADEVLHSGVRGVTDLIVMPGLINLDFADIRTVMSEMGKAMMGTGEASGDRRAIDAAEAAISNPLLDEVSLKGARAMLINITAGPDLALFEVDEVVNRVRSEVDPDANVIFGSTFDATMEGKLRVSVVATGIETSAASAPPVPKRPVPVPTPTVEPTPVATPAPVAEPPPEVAVAPAADPVPGIDPTPVVDPAPAAEAPPVRQSAFEIVRGGVGAAPIRPVSPYGLTPAPATPTGEDKKAATEAKASPKPEPKTEAASPVEDAAATAKPKAESPEAALSILETPAPVTPRPIDLPPTLAGRLDVERVLGTIAKPASSLPPLPSSLSSQPLSANPSYQMHPRGTPEPQPKRSFTLFERLTGAARRAGQDSEDS